MKIIHIADLHACTDQDKQKKLDESLSQIVQRCKIGDIDYVIIVGDVWDIKQSFAKNTGIGIIFEKLDELSQYVKAIFISKGNNYHDAPGSIEPLHQLRPNIYAFENTVSLGVFNHYGSISCFDILHEDCSGMEFEAIFTLVPYLTIENLVDDVDLRKAKEDFDDIFTGFVEAIAIKTSSFTCPKIFAMHANVQGSKFGNGQPIMSDDPIINPFVLEKAKHDYYAFGHIHEMQAIRENMRYPGMPYHKDFGEVGKKYYLVTNFTGNQLTKVEEVPLTASRAMYKIGATFTAGVFTYDIPISNIIPDSEIRVNYKVDEFEARLVTDEVKQKAKIDLKTEFVSFNPIVIPKDQRSRSEEIMDKPSLTGELEEWGKIVHVNIPESVLEKVRIMQEVLQC